VTFQFCFLSYDVSEIVKGRLPIPSKIRAIQRRQKDVSHLHQVDQSPPQISDQIFYLPRASNSYNMNYRHNFRTRSRSEMQLLDLLGYTTKNTKS
jgi:hypothetical protein